MFLKWAKRPWELRGGRDHTFGESKECVFRVEMELSLD
jgi:hypothetical protein